LWQRVFLEGELALHKISFTDPTFCAGRISAQKPYGAEITRGIGRGLVVVCALLRWRCVGTFDQWASRSKTYTIAALDTGIQLLLENCLNPFVKD
jgi:hypothetical protein